MFTVIDNKTGEYPDCEKIVLKEEWAKGLVYCDIDGFYVGENGALIMMDDCGNARWCPADRFTVVPEAPTCEDYCTTDRTECDNCINYSSFVEGV